MVKSRVAEKALNRLKIQINRLETSFLKVQCERPNMKRAEYWYLLEGLLSQFWQAWCGFCRQYCISHSVGYTFSSGTITQTRIWANSNDAARYNLTKLANNRNCLVSSLQPYTGNFVQRYECTWGDPDKLLNIFLALNTAHERTILNFPEIHSLKHLQITRNCTAHITSENQVSLRQVALNYRGNFISHPTDFLSWETPSNNDYVFVSWLIHAQLIAEFLCSQ